MLAEDFTFEKCIVVSERKFGQQTAYPQGLVNTAWSCAGLAVRHHEPLMHAISSQAIRMCRVDFTARWLGTISWAMWNLSGDAYLFMLPGERREVPFDLFWSRSLMERASGSGRLVLALG
eukprot:gnl/MRDRNA2_/MRDRNA2_83856_c0_seq1.p2 gnl/MRDRNA2_/MRDRNA2_83856_c0~~gnl/MRDRNA2_/MRDRNA2_83856_c0_seq1.p2  ORF type:complete len:120 (+),score=10.14 gnl/MRDRNA2_/MRDRNA2_83856_c0_seq1:552-911(+)